MILTIYYVLCAIWIAAAVYNLYRMEMLDRKYKRRREESKQLKAQMDEHIEFMQFMSEKARCMRKYHDYDLSWKDEVKEEWKQWMP